MFSRSSLVHRRYSSPRYGHTHNAALHDGSLEHWHVPGWEASRSWPSQQV